MTFEEILDQAIAMLQRRGRLTYGALKRQFNLDDAYLEDLKAELIEGQRLAIDEAGRVLVWIGHADVPPLTTPPPPQVGALPVTSDVQPIQTLPLPAAPPSADAERRQLTVMFCDLVESTALATQLDPEDLREVVRAYQETAAAVIQRFEGHIAQYLGDGLLVYFGYPQAHEDDARRAVRTGLGIVETLGALNARLAQHKGVQLAVRIGIHTGLVVVGEMGGGSRQEQLALGETPNIAARLQGLAAPDTVVISPATFRLVRGYFTCQDLGTHPLKGLAAPLQAYRILGESAAQSRLDAAGATGLTSLVGRDAEVALLLERWTQSQDGIGQVVLLRGEAGIGKSRLVEVLRERVRSAGATRIVFRCSPYYQHSALYPVIDHLQRFLQWQRDEAPEAKFDTLERVLRTYRLPLEDVLPLFAALLSVPLPERYSPLNLTPQRQRQKTHEALVAWLLEEAERQPVLTVWEDLHWADPSTLDVLSLLLDQVPTARMLTLLTCRPEFRPPWATHVPVTQVTLNRLGRTQVEAMLPSLAGAKTLPPEVVEQVIAKTDGVPLFVEELVIMILESGLVQEQAGRYVLIGPLPPLAIPSTLHDSLMARLDRLATARELVQLGAVLGREFAYDLLQAVALVDERTLQHGLARLVEAELVYQRGLPPRSQYIFKHALIQDAAYQSLLRSTRQRYHQRIAQVLEAQFPDTALLQPELVAHHYTEAGLSAQAVRYWQQAGQRAHERSAHVEAIGHLTKGLEVLTTLPDTLEHRQQELALQLTLGPVLMATKGLAAPETGHAYTRARALCQQVGETPLLFPALGGLVIFYLGREEYQSALELGEQMLSLAQRVPDSAGLANAHITLGNVLYFLREWDAARTHLEQGVAFYNAQQHRSQGFLTETHQGVFGLIRLAQVLWSLGYPDQAMQRSREALTLARELVHPASVATALFFAADIHMRRREGQSTYEQAEAALVLAREHGFALRVAQATILRGWALVEQGQREAGIAQICQGQAAHRATGAERGVGLDLLAEAYGRVGQREEGLRVIAEALAKGDSSGAGEVELYRVKGELLLRQRMPDAPEAEICFRQALDSARRQQAKSLELRAAMSLARLWQRHGKRAEACALLAPIYGWFTEGFDTADLQDARALLHELEEGQSWTSTPYSTR
jgi:predicted ATPase/class 3 adenylate cyclase